MKQKLNITNEFDMAMGFKMALEKKLPGINEKLTPVEMDTIIDMVYAQAVKDENPDKNYDPYSF